MLEDTQKQIRQHLHDISGELFLIRGTAEIAHHRFGEGSRDAEDMTRIMERVDNVVALCNKIRATIPNEQEPSHG